jgi:hypothetical protein
MQSMTAPTAPVTVGVDTHLDRHVAAVLDQNGRLLATQEFPASTRGYVALVTWAERFGPVERIGVEGTGTYGAGLTRFVRAYGLEAVEVNRPDRSLRRRRGKSDPIDAQAAARRPRLGWPPPRPRPARARRRLLPPATDRHPEHRSGNPALGVADLGVVGEVAGEADACLGHGPASVMVLPSWDGLAGRSAVSLAPGGWWTPWHANRPQGQAMEPTKSAIDQDRRPWPARVPGWLVECLRLGWACRHRPARSLHPGCGGRTRLPPRGPLAGPSR